MADRKALSKLFKKHGFADFKWISGKDIAVGQWVRMKCTFGCSHYGKGACCPPNTPSVAECERFFKEYETAVIFHVAKKVARPEDRHDWSPTVNIKLWELEREVFIADYPKAFLMYLDSCGICKQCSGNRLTCKSPTKGRPAPEAMAVDVFTTVKRAGYDIAVLPDYDKTMNRYAILLVE